MKKTYSKPEIIFESFKMTSSIANTCSGLQGYISDGSVCEIVDNGFTIFNSDNDQCDPHGCYHVSTDYSAGVFGS